MEDTIIGYRRGTRKRKIGMVVAWMRPDNKVYIGWSICHKGDKFDRQAGLNEAGRKSVHLRDAKGIEGFPTSLKKLANKVRRRAVRYFRYSDKPVRVRTSTGIELMTEVNATLEYGPNWVDADKKVKGIPEGVYKVGDIVRVMKDRPENESEGPGWVSDMNMYLGKELEVLEVFSKFLVLSGWDFSPDWVTFVSRPTS